jgi:hypothetical protein
VSDLSNEAEEPFVRSNMCDHPPGRIDACDL